LHRNNFIDKNRDLKQKKSVVYMGVRWKMGGEVWEVFIDG